ncbi:hypothetical protein niasHT_008423 [Heterodera trifolii]|uniref:Uncharacterized protein n=1 Tax=Heterodera trifolii TaxID=157864 RepID=A0ABD2M595_9BILA
MSNSIRAQLNLTRQSPEQDPPENGESEQVLRSVTARVESKGQSGPRKSGALRWDKAKSKLVSIIWCANWEKNFNLGQKVVNAGLASVEETGMVAVEGGAGGSCRGYAVGRGGYGYAGGRGAYGHWRGAYHQGDKRVMNESEMALWTVYGGGEGCCICILACYYPLNRDKLPK